MITQWCGIILLLSFLLYPSIYARDPDCVSCTLGLKVWCPQTRQCVNTLLDCPVMDVSSISWFINKGSCSVDPIAVFTSCPLVVANFDPRLPPGTVLSGNQIMIPIQPRILVDDFAANLTYDVGGFFSVIPEDSQQQPQFFFFSKSVDRFVASLHYRPYSNYENRDEFSVNSSQVIQFLDMTVVANVGLRYEMVFVVSRAGSLDHCAFTPSLVFQQTPTYYDFRFTLGAIGLVVWLLGTFALLNFMIYFNSREEREIAQRNLPLLAVSNSPNFPNSPDLGSSSQGSMDDVVVSVQEKKTFKEKFRTWRGLMFNECKKFVRSCSMSDKEFLTEHGVSLYHYIWFHRMAIIYIAICSAVACALGLPTDLVGGTNRDTVAGDFATSTIASIALDSYANLVHFFIVIINVSLAIGFVWRLRKLSFAVVIAEEQDALPAQEFAVEIKGLPKHVLDEQLLKQHFASIYGEDQIVSAHIPLAYGSRWKLEEIKEEKDKHEKELEETKLRPRIFRHFWHIYSTKKKIDAINYYEEKINKIRPKLKFTDPNRGTGYAYVTFVDRDVVRQCLKNNNHSTRWFWFRKLISLFTSEEVSAKPNPHFTAEHSSSLDCLKWSVMPAPLPSEIIWPNLENSSTKKSLLQLFGLVLEVVVLACVLSVTLGFALIEVTRDLYLTDVYYQFGGATMLEAIASLTIVILPEAVAIIEEVVAPVVETVEEKAGHVHKSGWRKTVMWHTAFFELMSGIVISRMIYFLIGVAVLYDAQPPLNSYHYLFNKTGMDMMKYMCIKTFTVYGIKYPALCLIKLFQARLSGKLERPDFDYFDLYAQKIMVMFCILMYGSVMPLILPLGVMYLGISFLYDRWAIVNFHKKDVSQDSKLLFYAADICSFYFAIVPLGTLVIITKLFEYWPALAGTLIGFSVIVGIVMIETRRWQYMNQNLKGVRKIIKASDHTLAKHMNATTPLVGADGAENNDNSNINNQGITEDENQTKAKQKWKKLANTTKVKDVFSGVMKGMREGVISTKVEKGQRTEEDVLRSAYIHPLSVTKI